MKQRPALLAPSLLAATALLMATAVAVSATGADGNPAPDVRMATNVAAVPFESGVGVYVPRDQQCVLFDTRGGEKVAANGTRTFSLTTPTTQGGEPNCVVPADAIGVHVNLVAIQPDTSGNLKIFGASETTEPNGGIVNFSPQHPNLNNSNAFVMDQDPTGWTVRSNGGPVHVRAVLYGFFHDGGQTFAANDHDHDGQYAATGHDHMIEQASGTATDIGPGEGAGATETSIDLGTQCPAGSNETHSVLVQYSGTLNQDLLVGLAAEVELQLFVDDVEVTDAVLDVEVTNLNVTGKVPVARSWLLGDLDPGSHTIEIRAERQDALVGPVTVELDLIVESRGWTC